MKSTNSPSNALANGVAHSLLFADYGPGQLSSFYIMLLSVAVGFLFLIVAGVSWCARDRRTAGFCLKVAGMCLAVGFVVAFSVMVLSSWGVVHLI
jgi:hypothetical protein